MNILEKVKEDQIAQVKNIMEGAAKAKPKGTVLFGDSLLQFFPIATYFPKEVMYNCGCQGATTDLLLHLQPYAVRNYDPSRVILLAGTNDLNDEWRFDRLEIAFNIYKLITIMRNHNPSLQVIVISPLPIREETMKCDARDNVQLRLLGDEIRNNCEEFTNTYYVNMYPFFLDAKGQLKQELTSDGLHLNEQGYALFASLLREYIEVE